MRNYLPFRARKASRRLFPALLFLASLAGGPLTAQPTLLKDINASPAGSLPDEFTEMNGALYFVASGAAGREIYRTDGTATGTTLLKDITPRLEEAVGGVKHYLTPVNNLLFFRKEDGPHGYELWKSDGTPGGTLLVKDIYPGPGSSIAEAFPLTAANGMVYLRASDGKNGSELWRSDGTAAGTVLVKDITPGGAGSDLVKPAAFGGMLYFIRKGADYHQLWKSDGTAAGTVMVKELAAGLPSLNTTDLVEANGVLYFGLLNGPGGSDALWRSDGTEAGTYKVKDLATGKPYAESNTFSRLVNSGGTLYFTYPGQGLWKSDGTEAGTVLVKNFSATGHSADGTNMTPFAGGVYFAASDANGTELWKSEGTQTGTAMVKGINPGSGHAYPRHLTLLQGKLCFEVNAAFDPMQRQLWCSDGTAAGTQLLKAIPASTYEAAYQRWTAFNGHLYFGASDLTHGFELWQSDGTTAGTALLRDIYPGSYGSSLRGFVQMGGKLLFTAFERGFSSGVDNQGMLYQTDGTPEGTASVHRVNPNNASFISNELTKVSPNLFYYASGTGLYRSDGTPGGGILVKSFMSNPTRLTNLNGTLYFVAQDSQNGEELWKTDGTPAGTIMVKDIAPNQGFFYYSGLTALNGLLFFRVDDGIHGMDLWRSDGTEAGSFLLRDFEGTGFSEGPSLPVFYKGEYYFSATIGGSGRELWKTDGTAAGTVPVADIAAGAGSSNPAYLYVHPGTNTLYFSADDGVHGRELWRSDGTPNGTTLVKDSRPDGELIPFSLPADLGPALLFIADDGQSGRELWKTDGTADGTVRLKDINPGAADAFYSFHALSLHALNGVVYFTATNGGHGEELWRSDGTAAGTFMLADLLPGPFGSSPGQFYAWNNSLYFAATDAVRGRELWRYDPAALLTVFATSPLCTGSTLSVPFDAGKQAFDPGNVFTVELSDADGSFRAPKAIGTLAATGPAAIAATLPAGVVPGGGYRIRVNASSPALMGSDNGNNLTIAAPPVAAITVTGAMLSASEGTAYRWFLDGAALAPTTRTLLAQQSGSYAAEVTNAAGCTARSAAVNVEVTGIEAPGAGRWTVFPNPSGGPVTVAFAAPHWDGARLALVDARGRTVYAATVPAGAAGETLQLDLTPHAPGVYLLVLHGQGKAAYRKIVKR
ncbi:MAG: T9SS type A sorting domain-containing protein [Cytophagales bacterium]|nr:T9SS type A sorting domain-containing protein [Cytophagales bacterium]